jgi:membrane fusion protein (multidrug efflux system)
MQKLRLKITEVMKRSSFKELIEGKGGKAKFVTVKTGVRQAGLIEITEGLQPGDTVCTTGMLFLRPDAQVNFSKID